MKKIVGILAAAAVLATSVFAADVSAKVKLDGKLLNVDTTKEKDGVSAVSIGHAGHEAWNPVLKMAVSGDNYGAEVDFFIGKWDYNQPADQHVFSKSWQHGYGIASTGWKIWFKPIDVLKFDVGQIVENTNQESIDYDAQLFKYDEWGYRVGFSTNGFTLNVAFHQGADAFWFSQAENGDAITKGLNVFASYGADFGTILAVVDFNDTFRDINAAVGYNNTFGDIRLFVDAGIALDGTKDQESVFGAGFDVGFKYAKDAITFEAYALFKETDFKLIGKDNDPMSLYFKTQFQYALDPCTLFVYFKDENFMAKKFASTIKAGATGSVGACNWECYAQIDTGKGTNGDKLNFAIPVSFSVAF